MDVSLSEISASSNTFLLHNPVIYRAISTWIHDVLFFAFFPGLTPPISAFSKAPTSYTINVINASFDKISSCTITPCFFFCARFHCVKVSSFTVSV